MLVYEFLLWYSMLFFTQGRPGRPPLKRNGYRSVRYKTKISCLTWSLNKVTVFYLNEGRADVSWEELAPIVQEEMSGKIKKQDTPRESRQSVSKYSNSNVMSEFSAP